MSWIGCLKRELYVDELGEFDVSLGIRFEQCQAYFAQGVRTTDCVEDQWVTLNYHLRPGATLRIRKVRQTDLMLHFVDSSKLQQRQFGFCFAVRCLSGCASRQCRCARYRPPCVVSHF